MLDNVQQWLRDFHVDGLRLDAVHELHDDTAAAPARGDVARGRRARRATPAGTLWLVAESDRNDPGTVTPRGAGDAVAGLGRARPVGRRRAPRAARRADRRDPGLLRRLRRPRARWPRCCARRSSTTAPSPPSAAARHGRPVDAGTVPGWRFVASLQTHDQVGNRAQGDRLSGTGSPRPRPARLRRRDPADLAVDADAVHGRGVGRPHPVAVLHRPHRPRHRARPPPRGRKAEFGSHGWDEDDVPDPQDPETFRRSQARLVRARPGAARPAAARGTAT